MKSEFSNNFLNSKHLHYSASFALQRRPVSSKPAMSLFDPKISSKRKRPSVSHKDSSSKKSRKRSQRAPSTEYLEEESDFKLCQAHKCLKPYGDSVNWVQCDAGCKNWFHLVCVGFTLRGSFGTFPNPHELFYRNQQHARVPLLHMLGPCRFPVLQCLMRLSPSSNLFYFPNFTPLQSNHVSSEFYHI